MDNIYCMLKKIRGMPGLFLGKKSLESLVHFWNGYTFGSMIEVWEQSNNRNFFENYEEAMCAIKCEDSKLDAFEFNKYVHNCYNQDFGTKSVATVIIENSKSDEDAFDTFFELLDEFMSIKEVE